MHIQGLASKFKKQNSVILNHTKTINQLSGIGLRFVKIVKSSLENETENSDSQIPEILKLIFNFELLFVSFNNGVYWPGLECQSI